MNVYDAVIEDVRRVGSSLRIRFAAVAGPPGLVGYGDGEDWVEPRHVAMWLKDLCLAAGVLAGHKLTLKNCQLVVNDEKVVEAIVFPETRCFVKFADALRVA